MPIGDLPAGLQRVTAAVVALIPGAGDLVSVAKGEVFVADRLIRVNGELVLATFGYRLDDLVALGANVTVLEKAPTAIPESPGFYLDNLGDVWKRPADVAQLVRVKDLLTITEIPEGYSVTPLTTLPEAAAQIADYFTNANWTQTARRIREQFIPTITEEPVV